MNTRSRPRLDTPRQAPDSKYESAVRLRGAEPKAAPQSLEDPPDAALRCLRIEQKVRMGRLVLDSLPATDTRARLLRTALIRRDEVLIDAVLGMLRMAP